MKKFAPFIASLLFLVAFSMHADAAQNISIVGTASYFNGTFLTPLGGGNALWPAFPGVNVAVRNATDILYTGITNPSGFFSSGYLIIPNGTINVTFTTPFPAAGPNQNISVTIRNLNISDSVNFRNGTLNLTFRTSLDNSMLSGENLFFAKPSGNATQTSYLVSVGNKSVILTELPIPGEGALSATDFRFAALEYIIPTKIAFAPNFVARCNDFNSTRIGFNDATSRFMNFCENGTSSNLWTFPSMAGLSYGPADVNYTLTATAFGSIVAPGEPNNETALLVGFWADSLNPQPKFELTRNISARGIATGSTSNASWAQIRSNYSFPAPMIMPNMSCNATGCAFNGMVMATNTYAPLMFANEMFFRPPTIVEFLAYNLTFNVTFSGSGTGLVNITPFLPDASVTCGGPGQEQPWYNASCGGSPLYKNQSLLPASFMTFQQMVGDFEGEAQQPMTVLVKNPGQFVIFYMNATGSHKNVTGTMNPSSLVIQSGHEIAAAFIQGKIVINTTGTAGQTTTIKMMLGTQDETCFNFSSQGDPSANCMNNVGPPKFESTPVFIANQNVVGTNPFKVFEEGSDVPELNATKTTAFVINVTNPFLNYSGNNLFAEFRFPLNVTIYSDNFLTVVGSQNVSESMQFGWHNQTSAKWQTINASTTPSVIISDGCMNFKDSFGPGKNGNENMTMCFRAFVFNLSQSVSGIDQTALGRPIGWVYNSSAVLNLSFSLGFKILNQQLNRTGGTGSAGGPGTTNQYNFTVAGGQSATQSGSQGSSTGSSSSGFFEINDTFATNLSRACARPGMGPSANPGPNGTCANISIYVNGEPYYNWTSGSIIFNSQSTNPQSISAVYSVPTAAAAGTTTTTTTTSGSGGGGIGGTTKATVTVSKTSANLTFSSISAGNNSSANVGTTFEAGVRYIEISVINAANNIKIFITKIDQQPAIITKNITGKVYKYMEINTENLGSNLKKAKVRFAVSKSWLTDNNVDAAKLRLFRYTSEWVALTTSKVSEDSNEVLFEAETTGFSTFAIAEYIAPTQQEQQQQEQQQQVQQQEQPAASNPWALPLMIIIIVIAGAWYYFTQIKGKGPLYSGVSPKNTGNKKK